MHTTTMKRVLVAAVALVAAGALGACADEPMAPEEAYEVEMDETNSDNCVVINGQLYCN